MKYKAVVSYDGTNYSGWQVQPNSISVQQKLVEALENLTQENINVYGAGRTDAGVHALGQVCHFSCDKEFSDITKAINSQLPADIHVMECEPVDDDFHARFNALWKYYSYMINTSTYNPLQRNYVWQLEEELDVEKMQEVAQLFIGTHDFTSFNATKLTEVENQVRTIYDFEVNEYNGVVSFDIFGDGFLRHMVRMLVGTLVEVGKGKLDYQQVEQMLESKSKEAVAYNAPACGLYLVKIGYEPLE